MTKWFLVRAVLMGVMFFGFGGYFFYDAAIGYPRQNEVFFTYQGFKKAGDDFETLRSSSSPVLPPMDGEGAITRAARWACDARNAVLWRGVVKNGRVFVRDSKGNDCPLPEGAAAAPAWPAVLANYDVMASGGWSAAWNVYSGEHRLPSKPGEKPHDAASIREQWIAGSVCMVFGLLCLGLLLRTMGRRMSLSGNEVCAAGRKFSVADIRLVDLRQWKLKGLARFTVEKDGRTERVRVDGMTYGGFDKEQGEPAERFMQAVLALYGGDVLVYEEEEPAEKKGS